MGDENETPSMDTSTECTRLLTLYTPGKRAKNSYIGSLQQLDSRLTTIDYLESTYLLGSFDLINVLAT
eukprot:scaffold31886_cov66-Attheya_sp.AAC.2